MSGLSVPHVLVNRKMTGAGFCTALDNSGAARLAMNHLLGKFTPRRESSLAIF
jgi:DNA-binding LacI/PurR family transcriptional regulator